MAFSCLVFSRLVVSRRVFSLSFHVGILPCLVLHSDIVQRAKVLNCFSRKRRNLGDQIDLTLTLTQPLI